jgi:hypothetical protein
MPNSTEQPVLFPELLSKPVHVRFDALHSTSDGGALLLKAADQRYNLTRRMARCLADSREPGKVQHSLLDLFRQRIYGLCCGYSDANDVARIGRDPMHKLLLDRDPLLGPDLASQPTLSRFENGRARQDLYRLGASLMDSVIERHGRRLRKRMPRLITIDLDSTDDPAHGGQQLALFNGHYGNWCYQPLLGFLTFDDEPDQYLVAAILRPGRIDQRLGAVGLLRRVLRRLRVAFPSAVLRVRMDGGFASSAMFDFLDGEQVEYLVAIARYKRLVATAAAAMDAALRQSSLTNETATRYGQTMYAPAKWSKERRVIYKAECVRLAGHPMRENHRFVVTNLACDAEAVYDIYRRRGDSENRIKELKLDLDLGRTSCSRFWANQLRVLLSAAAFVLMQELRLGLQTTKHATVQVETLRLMLLKIGGRIERSVRRIVVHLAANHPWNSQWRQLACAWGAAVP